MQTTARPARFPIERVVTVAALLFVAAAVIIWPDLPGDVIATTVDTLRVTWSVVVQAVTYPFRLLATLEP